MSRIDATVTHRARARYLNQALQLEEPHPGGIIGAAILVSTGLLFGALAWASVTRVDEVAHAPGEVVPAGYIHDVQHLEGGIVAAIHIRNGDHVQRGQPLLSLAPATTRGEYERLRTRAATLTLEAERLQALLGEREADFTELEKDYPRLAARQRAILLAQRAQLADDLALIDTRIRQRRSELRRQRNQARAIRDEIRLLREQVEMRGKLAKQSLVSKTELLAARQRLAETLGEQRHILDGITVAEAALNEAREERKERLSRFRRDTELESGRIEARLAETRHELEKALDRLQRLEIRSPADGIVQGLTVTAINAVIEPGQVILRVVPVGDELLVEARVGPRDIGHVHRGQRAEVRFAAFDAARFGRISGTLTGLSASTYVDASGQPYYRAEIRLDSDHVGDPDAGLRILPGMSATADIRTGAKTIMAYLMKPVSRGFANAFAER